MEKTKLEQPVPFEDIHFRRSEGGPSVLVIEKPVPMNDANYRHGRQLVDSEQVLSFEHFIERYSIAEQQSTQDGLDDVASHLGFGLLSDPGADKIMFWDDSEDSLKWLDYADELIIFNKKLSIDHDLCTNFESGEHFTMLDEDNMVSDSATQAATQQSAKAYVDNEIIDLVTSIVCYEGEVVTHEGEVLICD